MGGTNLHKAFEGASKDVSVNLVAVGQVLGMDASVLLHKYVFPHPDAAVGYVVHGKVDGLAWQWRIVVEKLMKLSVTWLFVFDGTCQGKQSTTEKRESSAAKAKLKVDQLVHEGASPSAIEEAVSCCITSHPVILPD